MALSSFIDQCTKWCVAVLAFWIGCAHTREDNVLPPYYLLWALATAGLGKVIKRKLAHSRPKGSKRPSHGMPSSHATSLSCLSVIATVAVAGYDANGIRSALQNRPVLLICVMSFPLLVAVILTILRVTEGHHSPVQVLAGWILGAGSAATAFLMETHLFHVNTWDPATKTIFVSMALVAAFGAGARNWKTWIWGDV
jgi:dolichyldiphosphatase